MFTRSELEAMTLQELKALCLRYSVRPTGNAGYKVSHITSLLAFPGLALHQLKERRGLKTPSFASFENMSTALDEINSPTDEQMALIRISMEGKRMEYPDRYDQEKLLSLYKAKLLLEELVIILKQ
ncbi:hypothetical protein I8748_27465 [Nostoc sp. CENA67]|uniref:Uncharacterized protein n=1 Tax=Amazonocrinis nigriterrae CENA67 TaxID=2794033 RepID=A0A8J7HYM6_9NOST|nr:hypothetical protein [Amazonocrinis nigriterrae]MBH8565862.1 hypothetical protein [Amazonocrinis nigriterrae CENA67]